MSTVTAPTVTPDAIFQLSQGFMASKLLFVAGDIGLFEQLGDGPLSTAELTARLKMADRGVGVVANAMVAVGMLTLTDSKYANSEVAQAFLSGRGPGDMRPLLKFWDRISYPAWMALNNSVKSGGEKAGYHESFSPEDQAIFSAGVEAASTGGAVALAATYDFARCRRVLDIGGGTGSFLKAIRQRHPQVETTLFELPATAEYARSRFTVEEAGQIAVIEGDMLKDAIPGGYDAMILAHILHVFSTEQNRALLKRLREAAQAGCCLLLVDFFLDETRTFRPL